MKKNSTEKIFTVIEAASLSFKGIAEKREGEALVSLTPVNLSPDLDKDEINFIQMELRDLTGGLSMSIGEIRPLWISYSRHRWHLEVSHV
jgi:hypothetical protein